MVSTSLHTSLVNALYAEALLLADEARAWFDRAMAEQGHDALHDWPGRDDAVLRIALSCESLRLTTRLMHIIAWLLLQRAIAAGELPPEAAAAPANRLGPSPDADDALIARLPDGAQKLVASSRDLYRRVAQLDAPLSPAPGQAPPVAAMMDQLLAAF